ncbi:hypothetical protein K2Z84_14455 [Candidatus Binatia bacterium]|nr:hypothetical protein [Candidatus Binatia bacterium]
MKWGRSRAVQGAEAMARAALTARMVTRAVLAALVVAACPGIARAQRTLPAPSYDDTLYAYVYGEGIANPSLLESQASLLASRLRSGPYAKVGLAEYLALDMPWGAGDAALASPSAELLEEIASGARRHGLLFHVAAMGGMSRFVWVYADAKREDRRNAQWFASGAITAPAFAGTAEEKIAAAYVTPSRYARRLRRHLEAKVRAFAARFLALRAAYPDVLVTASGDAEAELNGDGETAALGFFEQPITDYGPFAILEFRDWLLHAGLYAPGGPFDGDGYDRRSSETFTQGPGALGAANLALFNQQVGTSFASWDLRYFHWSLSDPVDGDPRALGAARTDAPGWSALPTSGPDLIPGGFDAPRSPGQYGARLWDLWLDFRQHMLASYARDFATWMTTTPGPDGATLDPDRWYSHQIPADYLNGTRPGSATPERRLMTSASPFWTSIVGADVGSPGVTVLDRLESGRVGPTYRRTSQYLFGAITALALPNWGMPEYAPSWHVDVAPEGNAQTIVAQYQRAVAAGVHMFAFTPWPHFAAQTANGVALASFVNDVKYRPRGGEGVAWLPPAVRGLAGSRSAGTAALSWSGDVFAEEPGFAWTQWPQFLRFEVWRGAHPGFGTADGRPVASTTTPSLAAISLDASRPYYKVRAVARDGGVGPFSGAVGLAATWTGIGGRGVRVGGSSTGVWGRR